MTMCDWARRRVSLGKGSLISVGVLRGSLAALLVEVGTRVICTELVLD